MSYENPWIYDGRTFDSIDIGDYFGFVYLITNKSNGRSYIGRKYFWSFRTPPGKKRKVKQESDWKKYYGSCPELKEDIKKYNKETFSREILSLHDTKGQCNYEETKQLFINNDVSYENPWTFDNKPFDSIDIGDYFGFVYLITNKSMDSHNLH